MTTDERTELLNDATDLAYTHIKFSGPWRELSNEQWERMAREHAEQVVGLLEQLVDERLTQIESARSIPAHRRDCGMLDCFLCYGGSPYGN